MQIGNYMTAQEMIQCVEQPGIMNAGTLAGIEQCIAQYPYFQTARMLYVRNLYALHDVSFDATLSVTASLVNREQLWYFLQSVQDSAPETQQDETDLLVLEKERPIEQQEGLPQPADNFKSPGSLLEIEGIQQQAERRGDEEAQMDIIDRFLAKDPSALRPVPNMLGDQNDISSPSITEHDDLITESLARIYVLQKLYDKAIRAYEILSLKYPEKSVYFAEQIQKVKQETDNK